LNCLVGGRRRKQQFVVYRTLLGNEIILNPYMKWIVCISWMTVCICIYIYKLMFN